MISTSRDRLYKDPEKEISSVRERFRQIAKDQEMLNNETEGQSARRNIGQNVARSLETVVGMPGNFKKAAGQAFDYFRSFLPEDIQDTKQLENESFGEPAEGSLEGLLMNPPGSQELRENITKPISEKLTGEKEYLEPKTGKEKAVGEFTQDLTSFFLPGTGQMRMATRIGAPILGNLTKQGMKYLGAEESTAEKTKLGVMLATTLANQSNPGRFANDRIAQGKAMVPDTMTVDAAPLANSLLPLHNRMIRGFGVPSKSRAVQGMRELAEQSKNGRINMRSLMDARDNINEWISEAGGWDIPKATKPQLIRNLNELKSSVIETIESNLSKRLPQAEELYRTGYEASAVNHQSNSISNFIEKNFGKQVNSMGAKLLFPALTGGAALGGGGALLAKGAGIAGLMYGPYKAYQVLHRVGNSPTLGRYYSDVINNSVKGNAPAMIKSLDKLDKELAKQEEKENKGKKLSLEEFKSKFKNRD